MADLTNFKLEFDNRVESGQATLDGILFDMSAQSIPVDVTKKHNEKPSGNLVKAKISVPEANATAALAVISTFGNSLANFNKLVGVPTPLFAINMHSPSGFGGEDGIVSASGIVLKGAGPDAADRQFITVTNHRLDDHPPGPPPPLGSLRAFGDDTTAAAYRDGISNPNLPLNDGVGMAIVNFHPTLSLTLPIDDLKMKFDGRSLDTGALETRALTIKHPTAFVVPPKTFGPAPNVIVWYVDTKGRIYRRFVRFDLVTTLALDNYEAAVRRNPTGDGI